ncbi:HlyD family type I secretion periplasmic adaptor subunit [Paracoccus jeotgali]|uniref:Membrane fusion protein (MFP) family protein n=1 Tax=Paracoccus jeotgali TaxID=2065379 RepID=A0A2K9ML78_9RHOB|nr:HlyD family type I secretion periplasmic adaptor subunit [Paracoccus jeotgali]AUM75365.1 HlyD family type I secretion periplasmic adaptor subunit [Paracoccus jeotgali]
MTDATDFEQLYSAVPRSTRWHMLLGLLLLALSFGGFGVWAFRAPLAAAVMAPGSFVATGRNKIVQHLEGGIINEILVEEGDFVAAGETLLVLDQTAANANQRELELRRARLEAITARLSAEYRGLDQLDFPQALLDRRDLPEIDAILDEQHAAFAGAKVRLQGEIALLESNTIANQSRIAGFQGQLAAVQTQIDLLEEDFVAREALLERGLVRRSEVNQLARAVADAKGQADRLRSQIAETEEAVAKTNRQIEQTLTQARQTALEEQQLIEADLDSIREQASKAHDVLTRAQIQSPVAGTIVRMHYHTTGGVIEAGKPIFEILPQDAPLLIEAHVSRGDVDDVRVGHRASVRLTSLNQRTTPVLEGELVYLSADALTTSTQAGAQEVFVVRIQLPPEELSRVKGFRPTPGMPAEIMIETASRTFAQYIIKPIQDSLSRAFREN